ncbi:hypothetical protein M422DRAFT_79363, partial [Sphaerobolus stellatus SS14]
LRQRCPACFGARAWGGAVEINPDVIVCVDGNFQHRRYSSVADDPPLINPEELFMYLTLEELEKAKEHIEAQRDVDHPARRRDAMVPPGSINDCEGRHNAAKDWGNDSTDTMFSPRGKMAMVCRHDVPFTGLNTLFLCDINTKGEQQFYSIALIQKLASMLPCNATIRLLYDIGCNLYSILSGVFFLKTITSHPRNLIPDIAPQLTCATAVFHVYAHQFTCQMVYNPRRREGFGWSNGEGNERLWS